jgi:hypothetical protein
VDLNFFTTWIQIHKVPVGYRKKALITNLTEKKVGKVEEVQTDVQGVGNFVRVNVKIDVRKPLARFVSMSRAGQREVFQIKFEKMPRFCGACGMIGHTHLECGTGEFEEDKLKWGDWLKAPWDTWHGRSFGGGRGGNRSGRGGRDGRGGQDGRGDGFDGRGRGRDGFGRGGGAPLSWRHNALPPFNGVEGELDDTGTSPSKNPDTLMDDRDSSDSGVKRRLDLDNEEQVENGSIDGKIAMITDGSEDLVANENMSTANERPKRSKKAGANSPSLGSANSREGSVREQ